MEILKNLTDCCGCSACASICPKRCIKMLPDKEGFLYPSIDSQECISCNLCKKACPVANKITVDSNPEACLVRNKNNLLREKSTAGGAFSAIAKFILNNDGVIFGVEFDDEFNVRHNYIEKEEDIYKFNRSKYVQSYIGESFTLVKKFLNDSRIVLFTGTPCQVEGLLNFLGGRDYENLYTMDIICKGVPSPKFWSKYLEMHYKMNKSGIKEIRFREKTYGYGSATMRLIYNDKTMYDEPYDVDPMLQFYNKEMISRPSCYKCNFKGKYRRSDFTVGDYWYIAGIAPHMDDGKGVTQILINSEKAKKAFKSIDKYVDSVNLDFENDAAINRGMMVESAKQNVRRKELFEDLEHMGIRELQKKYFPETFKTKNKIKAFLRPVLYKIGILKVIKKEMRKRQNKGK